MRPTTANVFDFNALLHPGTVFEHPQDVVHHSELTLAEKRADPCFLGIGRVRNSVLPSHARTIGPENARVDRRDL